MSITTPTRCPYCSAPIAVEPMPQGFTRKTRCMNCDKIVTLSMEIVAKKNCRDNGIEHVFEYRGSVGKCVNCDEIKWLSREEINARAEART